MHAPTAPDTAQEHCLLVAHGFEHVVEALCGLLLDVPDLLKRLNPI